MLYIFESFFFIYLQNQLVNTFIHLINIDTDDLQNAEIDEKALPTQIFVIRIVLKKNKPPKTLNFITTSIIEEVQETNLNDEIKVIDRSIELETELEIIPDFQEQVLVNSQKEFQLFVHLFI